VQCRDASKQGPENGLITFRNALWVSASAYALALTYFSDGFAPLAWVALIPFFVVIRGTSKLASAGYGALWGAVYFTLFGLIKPGLSPYSLPAFVVIGVICSALLALCLNHVSRRLGFNPLALGLAWLAFEIIRIELVLQFGTIAASQPVDGLTLNIAGLAGLSGLSFLIVLVNVLLIRLLNWAVKNLRKRPGGRRPEQLLYCRRAAFVLVQTGCYFNPEERGPP
jgi:apolipoprotein N-acyltransferase